MKKSFFWIALGVLSITLSLAVAELALRLLYPTPWYGYRYRPPQEGLFRHDPLLGWSGRPNVAGTFASRDFCHQVTLDPWGFRNTAPPYDPAKKNVLVLGDSFGWGWGVEDDEVFSRVMMRVDRGLNVYNLSAPGYGTDQQYLALNRFLEEHPEIRIDGVLVLTCSNDFHEVDADVMYGYPKPRFLLSDSGGLELTNVPVRDDKTNKFQRERELPERTFIYWNNSYLYNFLRHSGDRYRRFQQEEETRSDFQPKQLDLILALFSRIRRITETHGGFLHVVTIFAGPDVKYVEMRRQLDELGVGYTAYERSVIPLNELWIDRHLNAYGHRSLANRILSDISDYPSIRR